MSSESTDTTKSDFNFTHCHSVLLPGPLDSVFALIASPSGLERSSKLSPLCKEFNITKTDSITLPPASSLTSISVRHLPSSGEVPATSSSVTTTRTTDVRTLPRYHFTLCEAIKMVFGLITKEVNLEGTFTVDEAAKVALYESLNLETGITIWKLFEFSSETGGEQNVAGEKTRLKETIEGKSPGWMRRIVQSETSKAHTAHMERYKELFRETS